MEEDDYSGRRGGPTFDPPVYRQRYEFVQEIVCKYDAKKVIDFGCSEGKLISKLKQLHCVEELVGIDIDLETLEFNQVKAKPFTSDYLDPRPNPLRVSLYQGSVAFCDERFVNFDVIACVEIIEHLHPPELAAMPNVVFGHLLPRVVVVSTPNSEFNVLFPDMKKFRHYDHKFEWTRAEFQNWSHEIGIKYGYTVSFTGVGDGPPGTEHLGKCSQIAVFLRNDGHFANRGTIPQGQRPYIRVISCVHPYKKEQSIEECLVDELEYYILLLSSDYKTDFDSRKAVIPLERFLDFPRISNLTTDVSLLRSVLNSCPKFQLDERQTAVVFTRTECEWPSDEECEAQGKISKWDSDGVASCYNEYYNLECHSHDPEECWDREMETDQAARESWDGCGYPGSGGAFKDRLACGDLTAGNQPDSGVRTRGGCNGWEREVGDKDSNWKTWRAVSANDDCDVDDDIFNDSDIFGDHDYTW